MRMPRIRQLKPEFFVDEDLAEVSFAGRLMFQGLWVHSDREGRLEDRPMRLKAQIFPHDAVDGDALLTELERKRFIVRYEVGGRRLIWIRTFLKHQKPHVKEAPSVLPPWPGATQAGPGESGPAQAGAGLALVEPGLAPAEPGPAPILHPPSRPDSGIRVLGSGERILDPDPDPDGVGGPAVLGDGVPTGQAAHEVHARIEQARRGGGAPAPWETFPRDDYQPPDPSAPIDFLTWYPEYCRYRDDGAKTAAQIAFFAIRQRPKIEVLLAALAEQGKPGGILNPPGGPTKVPTAKNYLLQALWEAKAPTSTVPRVERRALPRITFDDAATKARRDSWIGVDRFPRPDSPPSVTTSKPDGKPNPTA